ncbi:MAG: COG4223 family protein, partial [Rhodospirillales bacterium]
AAIPDDSRARAVVLAVGNLREAINRNEPYDKALEALNAVGDDDPDVKVAIMLLRKTAATGIPTLATLRDRFQAIAGRIVHASKALEERGWLERAANRLSSLVTWRRVGDDGSDASVDAVVARAEARLKAGELKAAVDAVESLSATPKAVAVAASWLADAKARVAAEQAVATLHVHAVSLLAPAK